MKYLACALTLLLCCSVASAADPDSGRAGQQVPDIKALAPTQIEGLLAGKGMGYAKAAELNRYPGPAHVLELADELHLTERQLEATRGVHARMLAQAKRLGAQLVAAEAELERLFQEEKATEPNVSSALEHIAQLQAQLRGTHMLAHIEQRKVLSIEQITRYAHLRGITQPLQGHSGQAH